MFLKNKRFASDDVQLINLFCGLYFWCHSQEIFTHFQVTRLLLFSSRCFIGFGFAFMTMIYSELFLYLFGCVDQS